MQRYTITSFGSRLLRIEKGTTIVQPAGNIPARKLWRPKGAPFGKSEDFLNWLQGNK